jgi:hypothetical protein
MGNKIREYLILGLISIAPLAITIWVLWSAIRFLDGFVPESLQAFPGLGIIYCFAILLLTGIFAKTVRELFVKAAEAKGLDPYNKNPEINQTTLVITYNKPAAHIANNVYVHAVLEKLHRKGINVEIKRDDSTDEALQALDELSKNENLVDEVIAEINTRPDVKLKPEFKPLLKEKFKLAIDELKVFFGLRRGTNFMSFVRPFIDEKTGKEKTITTPITIHHIRYNDQRNGHIFDGVITDESILNKKITKTDLPAAEELIFNKTGSIGYLRYEKDNFSHTTQYEINNVVSSKKEVLIIPGNFKTQIISFIRL